ncbi:hypothetical protein Ae201684_012417 [Aphanomyces euteiches]|uniref:Transposase Tc1-like domain-containing protein n=1 Tax=Aphanomyces euteiches TaxID=100861 RepID=A0A6G0WRS9_9STRA|nr:hypothetical protein Ae201684_012417 [Aphanomyces euteiches]
MKNRQISAATLRESFKIFYENDIPEETYRRQALPYRANRLRFAIQHQFWSIGDWKKVLFTDESPFNLSGSNRRIYVWRKPGEEFIGECLVPNLKSGRKSVVAWGAINYNGVGTLRFCEGTMKSGDYWE